ncbi:hypothetical protein GCM10022206_33080 [Streptomyces chiangmaiensis]
MTYGRAFGALTRVEAWIPVVAVHRFVTRSGHPVGVGWTTDPAGAGRRPGMRLPSFGPARAGDPHAHAPTSKERPWRPA